MCKVPWLNAEELAHGGKVVHDIGEHLKPPITFAKASESSHLTCEELFKVFGSLGQHLGIFSTLIHLASLLKYHQAVKSLASIRCIYVSVTVSPASASRPRSYLCPSRPLCCGVTRVREEDRRLLLAVGQSPPPPMESQRS